MLTFWDLIDKFTEDRKYKFEANNLENQLIAFGFKKRYTEGDNIELVLPYNPFGIVMKIVISYSGYVNIYEDNKVSPFKTFYFSEIPVKEIFDRIFNRVKELLSESKENLKC